MYAAYNEAVSKRHWSLRESFKENGAIFTLDCKSLKLEQNLIYGIGLLLTSY